MLLLLNGRIAGISGIVGRLLQGGNPAQDIPFVVGLVLGPLVFSVIFDRFPSVTVAATWPTIIVAGLLVGLGTRMSAGCTSGHGIAGIARHSPRSIVATAIFLISGMATATFMGVYQ
ncbi:YeeE/YedE family protein [Xylella fastidiosa subsp. pauca]|nr:YeeE/YedE family protein [Xylella fastidiosa]MDG5822682.1 YeeE/YedE family protein [Xylella fastidiosa subsp. pauca]WGZ36399.1 YeeE/YedE family protein [Xylella fastidiosa subsp. pauca]